MIDITLARITHMEWVYQLELTLRNEHVYISIAPYDNCELGKWLYNEAINKYSQINEIETLENEHKLFHYAADRVVNWHNKRNKSAQSEAQAQIDFEEVKKRSKEIIFLLTVIEYKLISIYQERENKKSKKYIETIKSPLETLRRFITPK
ncbi:NM21-2 [weak similarity to] lipoprotein of MSR-1, hypothetical conserved in MTB [Candidatus Magnetoovum chiemensis]|nr:NM21-2 [weak similarity to] lipoprotein of MSR-1, hypothetical conserved in MTB [Candidatus Magnetoovum chiemensis]